MTASSQTDAVALLPCPVCNGSGEMAIDDLASCACIRCGGQPAPLPAPQVPDKVGDGAVAWRWRPEKWPSEPWQYGASPPGNSDVWFTIQPLYAAPPPPLVSTGPRPQEAVPTEQTERPVVALTRKTASALPVGTALEVIDADSFLRRNGFPNGSRVTIRGFDGYYIDIGEMPCPQGTCPERFALSTPQPADGCSSNEGAGGWIEWSGGENPVPGRRVEVRLQPFDVWQSGPSETFEWTHGLVSDIIAYRILPQTEKGS